MNDALCIDELEDVKDNMVKGRVSLSKRAGLVAEGALLVAKDVVQPITQPAINLARMVPGVVALTDPNTEIENARRVSEHNQETVNKLRKHRTLLDNLDQKTNR